MIRDTAKLGNCEFDLLVVGAGIYGAAIAWDAALRGLNVALIDRADFGEKNSSQGLNLIDGSLNHFHHLDFPRMRQAFKGRNNLLKNAPHFVTPLPYLTPTYAFSKLGKMAMKAILTLNDWVGMSVKTLCWHRLPFLRVT